MIIRQLTIIYSGRSVFSSMLGGRGEYSTEPVGGGQTPRIGGGTALSSKQ